MGRYFASLLNDLNKVFEKFKFPNNMMLTLIFVNTFLYTVYKLTGTGLVTVLRENYHRQLVPGCWRQVLDQSKRSPCLYIHKVKHIPVASNYKRIVLYVEPRQGKNLRTYFVIQTAIFDQTCTFYCLKQETWFIKAKQ